jgi:DNA-directed RNA polymerase subunit omega
LCGTTGPPGILDRSLRTRRKLIHSQEIRRTELEDLSVIIPMDKLINEDSNIYELTAASIRRAYQITVTGDEELDANQGKVVSTAIKQILTRKVQYQIEE